MLLNLQLTFCPISSRLPANFPQIFASARVFVKASQRQPDSRDRVRQLRVGGAADTSQCISMNAGSVLEPRPETHNRKSSAAVDILAGGGAVNDTILS